MSDILKVTVGLPVDGSTFNLESVLGLFAHYLRKRGVTYGARYKEHQITGAAKDTILYIERNLE